MCRSLTVSAALLLALGYLAGCATPNQPVTNIPCRYEVLNVDREVDIDRIDRAIRSVAIDGVRKTGDSDRTIYEFRVASLSDINRIHPQILFKDAEASAPEDKGQTLSFRDAAFEITYYSAQLSASMEVIVRFDVLPDSQLFYKENGVEKEITSQVDEAGNVELRTKIRPDQKYIYARTVLGEVQRYIRIDVFSQEVSDIDADDYR